MPIEVMVKEATGLQDKYVAMAVSYIQYLQAQQEKEVDARPTKKRQLGILADKFQFIADDFDETPEMFKEYM